jgi:hypothetical protein
MEDYAVASADRVERDYETLIKAAQLLTENQLESESP